MRAFDKRYYDRFYGRKRPRRRELDDTRRLCDFVCAYMRHIEQPVRSVIDVGCGLGLWRDALHAHFPKARYHGVEYSEYLCEEYGWEHGSVVDYAPQKPAELVICQDTVQYLPDRQASEAIRNLARMTHGALYFSAPTNVDWAENVDSSISDADVYKRPANWYRRRLQRHFLNLGGGVFLNRDSSLVLWELETLS
jgi:trans-aconitate methyltransferase